MHTAPEADALSAELQGLERVRLPDRSMATSAGRRRVLVESDPTSQTMGQAEFERVVSRSSWYRVWTPCQLESGRERGGLSFSAGPLTHRAAGRPPLSPDLVV